MPAKYLRSMALLTRVVVLGACTATAAACHRSGARPDDDFNVTVDQPTFTSTHPSVLFDEGHRNVHRGAWTYRPFVRLIESDGFRVRRNSSRITLETLHATDVLVIANALGSNERNDSPAFTTAECESIAQWVKRGGSLLLVTDHYPTGHAAAALAAKFGVDMSKGVTEDSTSFESKFDKSHIVFTRTAGTLRDHPVTEHLGRVVTFTGQSLGVPPGADALLMLGPHAVDLAPVPHIERANGDVRVIVEYGQATPARGRAQAVALEFGLGRVVILGEAAMISAAFNLRRQPIRHECAGQRQPAIRAQRHALARARTCVIGSLRDHDTPRSAERETRH